ncbi:MAG: AAA family ATPase [Anaerolineaceae bacterium]|nr:AAA family ATPase [Anaerolineaceae bacterium]
MAVESPPNPYIPPGQDDSALAPFAGRQAAFSALHRRITDSTQPGALLFLGNKYSGKTTLLRRFSTFFDETYIGVYLALGRLTLNSESSLLQALAGALTQSVVARDYTLSRIPEAPDSPNNLREWLKETYLPELFTVVRRHRFVLLLDDADHLLDSITAGHLPEDSMAYLYSLLEAQPRLGMALTLNSRREDEIEKLSPLVQRENVFRLHALTPDESAWLLQTPPVSCYTLSAESAVTIHKATGGQPHLLQRFGYHLFQDWLAHPNQPDRTPAAVKACIPRVYAASEGDFQQEWDGLNSNERLVLTAASQLLYSDPLHTIQTAQIEMWLVETDYPLDTTAINAAVRSLDYRDSINLTPDGLTIHAGLWQTWLLENARLPGLAGNRPDQSESQPPGRRRTLVIAAGLLLLLVMVIILATSSPGETQDSPLAPTVTLATGE